MPTKKKKFIDKKNSVTFQLVHRSQRDPLVADETAPQRVLLESISKKRKIEEEQKFGIYFDDNYDYLQHLKDCNEVADWEPIVSRTRLAASEASPALQNASQVFQLPSSVFQSQFEEKEGLLNKAATIKGPRPELDPDIVAALDDDFNFEDPDNELEDDFITLANNDGISTENKNEDDGGSASDSDAFDDEYCDSDEEKKTRFTNYSMSSSILPRSEILQTLDDRFEKIYEQYDEDEIGALDGEEIAGFLDPESELMKQLLKDHEINMKEKSTLGEVLNDTSENDHKFKLDCTDTFVEMELSEKPGRNDENKWDCESILSTYSNIYNRPKLIKEVQKPKVVKLNEKTGIPENVLHGGANALTKKALKLLSQEMSNSSCLDVDIKSIMSKRSAAFSIRDRNETPEERKERKVAVKELRKERRLEKKANKEAFKEEEIRQAKVIKNLKQNLQGIKII